MNRRTLFQSLLAAIVACFVKPPPRLLVPLAMPFGTKPCDKSSVFAIWNPKTNCYEVVQWSVDSATSNCGPIRLYF